MSDPNGHERYEELLMKVVDHVATEEEASELAQHTAVCEGCRAELDDFADVKRTTDAMTARILQDAQIESFVPSVVDRATLHIGWWLMLAGALVLIGMGGYAMATDPQIPAPFKAAFGAASAGAIALFVRALRTRWRASGRDPYEEIDR